MECLSMTKVTQLHEEEKIAAVNEAIYEYRLQNLDKIKTPNLVTQTALDECEAMIRGDMPMPTVMSTSEFIKSMEIWENEGDI